MKHLIKKKKSQTYTQKCIEQYKNPYVSITQLYQ